MSRASASESSTSPLAPLPAPSSLARARSTLFFCRPPPRLQLGVVGRAIQLLNSVLGQQHPAVVACTSSATTPECLQMRPNFTVRVAARSPFMATWSARRDSICCTSASMVEPWARSSSFGARFASSWRAQLLQPQRFLHVCVPRCDRLVDPLDLVCGEAATSRASLFHQFGGIAQPASVVQAPQEFLGTVGCPQATFGGPAALSSLCLFQGRTKLHHFPGRRQLRRDGRVDSRDACGDFAHRHLGTAVGLEQLIHAGFDTRPDSVDVDARSRPGTRCRQGRRRRR